MPRANTPPAEEPPAPTGLQKAIVGYAIVLVSTVVGTALFGPAENSERAFRLLHWWKRKPEPAPDTVVRSPRGQRR